MTPDLSHVAVTSFSWVSVWFI